jgi:hypothetical protein
VTATGGGATVITVAINGYIRVGDTGPTVSGDAARAPVGDAGPVKAGLSGQVRI